jgi:hypothetical protein
MNKSQGASGGILLPLLLVLFVGLKLGGIIAWSWWWVLAPLWGPFAIAAIVFVVVFLYAIIRRQKD